MPRIKITGYLPKAYNGLQTPSDDEWIRTIMEYEAKQGGYDASRGAYGLPNWGYNSKINLTTQPINPNTGKAWTIDDAIGLYKTEFLPKVQQYPMGLRERMGDYIYNTGRNPNDLLLYNAGKITLDQLNSPKTFDAEWKQYGPEIEKMYSDPTFINNLDKSRDDVYRTTKQIDGKPNPAYDATWKYRIGMFGPYSPSTSSPAPSSTPTNSEPTLKLQTATRNESLAGLPEINLKKQPAQNPKVIDGLSTFQNDFNKTRRSGPIRQNTYDFNTGNIKDEYGNVIGRKKEDGTVDMQSLFRRKAKQANSWMGNKVAQGLEWYTTNPTMKKINKTADKIVGTALAVSPIVDLITDRKKQRRWDKWFTEGNLSDNLYAVRPASMTGNRGDWEMNTGILRPDDQGFKSPGMYKNRFDYPAPGIGVGGLIAEKGGSVNMNNMQKIKIRITGDGLEKMATGGQPMTYSGQLGYGLNLGQKRIYTDMPPEVTENIGKKLQPVPRELANLEAEKGETVFGDVDGDGAMEHMEIGGEKHSNGGTPLNLPEGSFIFSDSADLRIKDKKILEKFNMASSKKGYTPAEIAKKYDTNKYKAIMEDPNADPLRKSTAQIMIKTFQKKLAELSLIQEEMKGFPQGIPEVAKKAMPQLQTIEDKQKQPGSSDQLQFEQQPVQQEQAPQMSEEQMMQQQPQMEFGGMIPDFALAGNVGDPPTVFNGLYNNDIDVNNIRNVFAELNKPAVEPDVLPDDTEIYDQTYTPAQRAALNDPEYKRFKELLDKYNTGKRKDAIYINSIAPEDANEFSRLATKFGFRRTDDQGKEVYRIVQGATPGYSFNEKNKKGEVHTYGFFGGYKPEMYEKKVIEDIYGKDASDRMTDIQRRRAFLKELGIDDGKFTDQQLSNSKTFYTGNQKFFKEEFYPAFTKTFSAGQYRPEMKDDMLIGAEHHDSYRGKPKVKDETVVGYRCTGRDRITKKANIISSSYKNMAALLADGAATSSAEAELQCPLKPGDFTPGKINNVPWDFMTPDKVSMLTTLMGAPRKYLPWGQKLPFEPGDVLFEDWRAKAAARQSLFNKMSNQLNTFSPGTSAASNLSFLAGQQAEGLAQDIAQVDARNVATANQFTAQERQRKDQNNLFNLAMAQDLWKGNVIANQQYDNAKRQYFNNMAKVYGNAWKNRMYLGLLNSVNPMFNIDPWQGRSWFKGGYGPEDIGNGLFASTTGSGLTYRERVAQKIKEGYTIKDARESADKDMRELNKIGTAGLTPKQQQYNTMRNMLPLYGALGDMYGFNADESI